MNKGFIILPLLLVALLIGGILLLTSKVLPVKAEVATLNLQVNNGINDAHEMNNDTGFASNTPLIRMGLSSTSGVQYSGGFRFANATIPQGATITNATFQCYTNSSSWNDPSIDIFAENADNSLDFTANPDVVNRPKTTASVNWTASDVGGWNSAPALTSLI